MRTHPSHIHTTPHPDWPQRFTELLDIDPFNVDWLDTSKVYWLRYSNKPNEHGRFWEVLDLSTVLVDELVKIWPAGIPSYLSPDFFELIWSAIEIKTQFSITNDINGLMLVGDTDTFNPNYMFYWVDPAGTRVRYDLDSAFVIYDDTITGLGDNVQIAIDNLWALINDDTLFIWDASTWMVPIQRPDWSPVQNGDRFEISVAGTIIWLDPFDEVKPWDVLVARVDWAVAVADYFATQGNVDNATLPEAIQWVLDAGKYITPLMNVERILLTDAPAIAAIIDDANWLGYEYIWPAVNMYKWQRYYDHTTNYMYENDWVVIGRTFMGQSISNPITLIDDQDNIVSHNFNSPNLHFELRKDGEKVDAEVKDIGWNSFNIWVALSWNYTYTITRWQEYPAKIYGSVQWGITEIEQKWLTVTNSFPTLWDFKTVLRWDNYILTCDPNTGDFRMIDPATGLDVNAPLNVSTGGGSTMNIRTDYKYAYITTGDATLVKVDLNTWTISASLPTPWGTVYYEIDLNTQEMFASRYTASIRTKYDLVTFTLTTSVASWATHALSIHDNYLYISTYWSGTVDKVDRNTLLSVASIWWFWRLAQNKVYGDKLYVIDYSNNNLLEFVLWAWFALLSTTPIVASPWVMYILNNALYVSPHASALLTEYDIYTKLATGRSIDMWTNAVWVDWI